MCVPCVARLVGCRLLPPIGPQNVPFLERVANVENILNAMLIKMEIMSVQQVSYCVFLTAAVTYLAGLVRLVWEPRRSIHVTVVSRT